MIQLPPQFRDAVCSEVQECTKRRGKVEESMEMRSQEIKTLATDGAVILHKLKDMYDNPGFTPFMNSRCNRAGNVHTYTNTNTCPGMSSY